MKLIIDIPEEIYKASQIIDVKYEDVVQIPLETIANGTPLPKGHGRLIDADSIYQIVRPIEQSDAEWGMTAKTAKQIIHDVFNKAPTIIEADKESEEE